MTTTDTADNQVATGNSSAAPDDKLGHVGAREATPEVHALKWAADTDSKVCWVEPDGEVMCAHAAAARSLSIDPPREWIAALEPLFSSFGWGPNKFRLAAALLHELNISTINDEWIPNRSFEAALSVNRLLKSNAPPLLLYNYTDLPKYIMGAYLLSNKNIDGMEAVLEEYDGPNQLDRPAGS